MPTERAHVGLAVRNQRTIDYLLADPAAHAEWLATIAFYKALHIIEAIFARDPQLGHGQDHGHRERLLKRNPQFDHIRGHYMKLKWASMVARYLSDNQSDYSGFCDYMTPDDVVSKLLRGSLNEVQKSARKFLSAESWQTLGL